MQTLAGYILRRGSVDTDAVLSLSIVVFAGLDGLVGLSDDGAPSLKLALEVWIGSEVGSKALPSPSYSKSTSGLLVFVGIDSCLLLQQLKVVLIVLSKVSAAAKSLL